MNARTAGWIAGAAMLLLAACADDQPRDPANGPSPEERRVAAAEKLKAEESVETLRQRVLEDRVARLEQDVAVLMAREPLPSADAGPPLPPLPAGGVLPPLAPAASAPPPAAALATPAAPARAAPPPAAKAPPERRQPRLTYDVD